MAKSCIIKFWYNFMKIVRGLSFVRGELFYSKGNTDYD